MPGRRVAAAVCALVLTTACTGGSGGSATSDPMAAPSPLPPGTGGGSAYRPATVLGTVTDPALNESSGLAASRRNPGLLWTHNDSGDDPFVYCLDLQARSCGAWRVAGAEAVDWEDMAAGPGPRPGEPYLYLGDIGDNLAQRTGIVVYRVPEPVVGGVGQPPTKAAPATTAPAEALRLRYPDGPHNAETLLVHPTTGDIYVISKNAQAAGVYKAPAPLDASKVTTLVQVGTIRLGSGSRGLELLTGGDISPDGRRVALSSYALGYELAVPAGAPFDDVWAERSEPVDLGLRLQGESVAYRLDGQALLTSSEILPWQLQQVERRAS